MLPAQAVPPSNANTASTRDSRSIISESFLPQRAFGKADRRAPGPHRQSPFRRSACALNALLGDPPDAPQLLRRRLRRTGVALSIDGGPGGGQDRAVGGSSPAGARSRPGVRGCGPTRPRRRAGGGLRGTLPAFAHARAHGPCYGKLMNRSRKSVAFAASPSSGVTPKISSTVRSVELWV